MEAVLRVVKGVPVSNTLDVKEGHVFSGNQDKLEQNLGFRMKRCCWFIIITAEECWLQALFQQLVHFCCTYAISAKEKILGCIYNMSKQIERGRESIRGQGKPEQEGKMIQ